MKTDGKKPGFKIATQEQQENIKNTRVKLKDIQSSSDNKENIVGRVKLEGKDAKTEEKPKKVANKGIQTGEAVITAADLTSEEPSLDYWKLLAEKRGESLNESLQELDKLREQNSVLEEENKSLQEENKICKEMLDESRNLVEILQEMIEESDHSANTSLNEAVTAADANE